MSLEQEALNAINEEKESELFTSEFHADEPKRFDFSFLFAKTGSGSIEEYIDHPLNFGRSKGMGQILRGATGLVGELDLAVVDIGIGAFNMLREGRENVTDHTRE